jgi:ABC-2 type transport system ATP-binding protein
METVIRTENLSKHYGKLKAVDDISISVQKGEIYGFLGLNGAGKTTTIRMLLGMIKPTAGSSFLNNIRVTADSLEIWKEVGYLVEVPYSYPDLTVEENLDIVRRLRLIPDRACVDRIIERLGLGSYRKVIAKNLSLGNAQRLGLAKAMIHEPSLLILDEPANGLDPAGIVEIREMLTDLANNKGVTIFISSHILGEISKFATRIGIIHEGIILHESSVSEVENMRKVCLQVSTRDNAGAVKCLEKSAFSPVLSEDGIIEMTDEKAISSPEMISSLLVNSGFPPSLLKVEEEDLEAFFLRVIRLKGGVR